MLRYCCAQNIQYTQVLRHCCGLVRSVQRICLKNLLCRELKREGSPTRKITLAEKLSELLLFAGLGQIGLFCSLLASHSVLEDNKKGNMAVYLPTIYLASGERGGGREGEPDQRPHSFYVFDLFFCCYMPSIFRTL